MLILSALLLQSASAATPTPTVPSVEAAAPTQAPLLHDTRGRPVMQVEINGTGPFAMVVDTAAQTSLIGEGLARELKLKPTSGGISVNGATGAAQSRLYPVERMRNALIDERRIALVELTNSGVTEARGIVGMESFSARKLLIDRSENRIAASLSSPPPPGFAAISGNTTPEGFVEIPATLDGVQVKALVDTGAAVTVVNTAAFRLLGWAENDPRLSDGGEIRGASAGGQKIRTARIAQLSIGRIGLSNVPIMISDDGDATPSMILGDDLLNLFPGYAVDFPRGELQIKLPPKRPAAQ